MVIGQVKTDHFSRGVNGIEIKDMKLGEFVDCSEWDPTHETSTQLQAMLEAFHWMRLEYKILEKETT